jgi:N-acetylmuramoyl-L-alanine amidase
LFVSIHLNAWATTDQGGVATFLLDTSDDSQALRLAARENGTEVSAVTELQKVLAGLYRRDQVAQSQRLAEAIHQQTLSAGRSVLPALVDRGVKRAMFYVLVGARMPAVLVEPSFITHPDEAQALTTDAYRDRLAAGIAAGIGRYARSL